ncbi:hypothetical protein [Bartonella sp. B41]
MILKCDKKHSIHKMLRNSLIILLLALLCLYFVLLYYFIKPQIYRATLTFSLSDSVGKILPINEQNDAIAFLFLQPIILNYSSNKDFSSSNSHRRNFCENLHLSRNGDLIDLSFEAETVNAARYGLESWFTIFSKTIIAANKKTLLADKKADRQYSSAEILNIVKKIRLSIDSFIRYDAKQTELNDLYVQLTEATLARIHLTSLNTAIKALRENGKSLLSLSFIAKNSAVSALESKRNLLETQKAHMAVQLGWTHPQIRAMIAESETISNQLDNKILQIVHQTHSDEIIARDFETQIKKRIGLFVKDQSKSLDKIFSELENKIREFIDTQNNKVSNSSSLSNIKIRLVIPTTVIPISFIAIHGKTIIFSIFGILATILGSILLLRLYFETKKKSPEKKDSKNDRNVLVSKETENFETFVTIEKLSNFLMWRIPIVVSIIGPEAARTAAKLSLHLIKERKTILLVDISGQQIEKVIGPHRGLSDILTGNAQVHDVIYRDYDTGVDILPQGLTSFVCAQDFSNNIPRLFQELKKEYDFIILEIADEPKYGFEQFAKITDYYICSVSLNEQSWMVRMVSRFTKTVYRVIVS